MQNLRNMPSIVKKSGRSIFKKFRQSVFKKSVPKSLSASTTVESVNQPICGCSCLSYSSFFLWLIDESNLATQLNPTSSEPIGGRGDIAMSAMETSLAALKDASALVAKIPFIGPVANLLLQALAMRNASIPQFS
jgi:hypothetical protein